MDPPNIYTMVTPLFILYLLSPQHAVLHILFHCTFYSFSYFYFLTYIIYTRVMLNFLHCPLSGPVLIYISLLIISCIIEYVTNKRTLRRHKRTIYLT